MMMLDSKKFQSLKDSAFPIGGFLRTGIFSLLVHFVLVAVLTLGLIPKHPRSGSVVYRVTLQPLPSQNDSIPETVALPVRPKPQVQKEESEPKKSIKQMELSVEKKSLDSEIQPPPQTLTPEIPVEEPKHPLRPQEKEQAPIPLPLGEPLPPNRSPDILVEDNPPVQFSVSHLGEESRNTNSSGGSEEQSDRGGTGSAGPGEGSGSGRGGSGEGGPGNGSGTAGSSAIVGFGDGWGQGALGWKGSGTGTGTGQGSSGSGGIGNGFGTGSGHGGSGNGSGTGRLGSGGAGHGNYGTGVSHPRHGENPKPIYPLEAREKGYKGEVLLKVEVLSNGLVGQIEVRRSSGHEILDRSALSTVRRWKFIPANKGGVAIPAWVIIPIKFELQ